MSIAKELYDQALVWTNEVEEHETLQVYIDFPGYGWSEIEMLSYGQGYVVARVRRLENWDSENWHEFAFAVERILAVRKANHAPLTSSGVGHTTGE